ncbi:1,4-dihydroxy-2-naphthoate polyprenyltransferase [Parvicella tangerina]|uniref:1,4-dihydroxy-2-naphthoate octaprenyltransferase n=1 Tax=Parvicella tangerina TaxID=2829795 RepID=A0A916NQ71_9FLAO|nr:1,4-dihydroxy-2-naphthoate polyprenyltransferase [Parvicella tangerina]CAG5078451.1 1,4-dihydroxy-2-naphthoate octaprenyltransferase [Parvicella tangerina]
MASVKDWISSFRLRTLPLALSCILAGSLFAYAKDEFDGNIMLLAAITTILLQVLSNIANDYGDGVKGTDNEHRVGPARAVQSQKISIKAMRNAIIINSLLAFGSGIILIYYALKDASTQDIYVFIGLGVLSILAAITYTIGKKAYGYSGLGDLFVFIFFGLVGVVGVYYLHTRSLDLFIFFPACFTGFMSMAVLNMNNMRDIENDKNSGKNTIVVKMGFDKAKNYHTTLLTLGMIAWISGVIILSNTMGNYLLLISLLPFILFFKNLVFVRKNLDPKNLDPQLKIIALGTFFTTVIGWLAVLITRLI